MLARPTAVDALALSADPFGMCGVCSGALDASCAVNHGLIAIRAGGSVRRRTEAVTHGTIIIRQVDRRGDGGLRCESITYAE